MYRGKTSIGWSEEKLLLDISRKNFHCMVWGKSAIGCFEIKLPLDVSRKNFHWEFFKKCTLPYSVITTLLVVEHHENEPHIDCLGWNCISKVNLRRPRGTRQRGHIASVCPSIPFWFPRWLIFVEEPSQDPVVYRLPVKELRLYIYVTMFYFSPPRRTEKWTF